MVSAPDRRPLTERRGEVAQLGLLALAAGSLMNLAKAAIAGVVAG